MTQKVNPASMSVLGGAGNVDQAGKRVGLPYSSETSTTKAKSSWLSGSVEFVGHTLDIGAGRIGSADEIRIIPYGGDWLTIRGRRGIRDKRRLRVS